MNKSESTIEIYNKIAEDYARYFKEAPEDVAIISKFIKSLPEKAKVLDVGCGNSDYFNIFNKKQINYVGIDLSKEMINVAKRLHPKGKFFVKDMRYLDFQNDSFEGIFCFYSLIHIPKEDVGGVLLKFNSLLKPKGKLLLALQEGNGEVFEEDPFAKDQKIFLNLFSEKEINVLLKKHGFEILILNRRLPHSNKELSHNKMYVLASKI